MVERHVVVRPIQFWEKYKEGYRDAAIAVFFYMGNQIKTQEDKQYVFRNIFLSYSLVYQNLGVKQKRFIETLLNIEILRHYKFICEIPRAENRFFLYYTNLYTKYERIK